MSESEIRNGLIKTQHTCINTITVVQNEIALLYSKK